MNDRLIQVIVDGIGLYCLPSIEDLPLSQVEDNVVLGYEDAYHDLGVRSKARVLTDLLPVIAETILTAHEGALLLDNAVVLTTPAQVEALLMRQPLKAFTLSLVDKPVVVESGSISLKPSDDDEQFVKKVSAE